MSGFLVGHATHPDWRAALVLAAAQIDTRRAEHETHAHAPFTLGFVYLTDHFAGQAQALVAELELRWPGVSWVGCVGVGVCASGVEYTAEPALALMLAALPVDGFEVFSGAHKLQRIEPFSALVHADAATPDLATARLRATCSAGWCRHAAPACTSPAVSGKVACLAWLSRARWD
jgi:small ligand-binding sensory domain FIST